MVVLSGLVFFHELGHFLVARWCGVTVLTFSIGFGPKFFSRKRGETEYCLSVIPLGGYVRMLGDDPTETPTPELQERGFLYQTTWKKMSIAAAGPVFNFILAMVIFVVVFMSGVPVMTPQIGEIQKGSAAEAGGMKPDDILLSIDGQPIIEWEEIRGTLQSLGGKEITFVVDRGGTETSLQITPKRQEIEDLLGDTQVLWLIGVQPKGTQIVRHYSPVEAAWMGVKRTWEISVLNVVSIFKMIQGTLSADNIGGPILIAQMASKQAEEGIRNVALFAAVISVSLGVMNLFPVPILDGGHLLLFAVEAILGRSLTLKTKENAQKVGLAMLASLMIFAIYNDLMRVFTR